MTTINGWQLVNLAIGCLLMAVAALMHRRDWTIPCPLFMRWTGGRPIGGADIILLAMFPFTFLAVTSIMHGC